MISRGVAYAAAFVAIVVSAAQIAFPELALFHGWQYALALAFLMWAIAAGCADGFGANRTGIGKRGAVGLCGAFLAAGAGLASGLLGPDTVRVVRAPGTVAPMPAIGAAAFFSSAGPAQIAGGAGSVIVRRIGHRDIQVGAGERRFMQAMVLLIEPQPAAYIEATDRGGNRLTITQPAAMSFLSPVLQFRDQQTIAGTAHRVDAFVLPAAHREVKVVLFTAAQAAALPAAGTGAGPVVLYAIGDGSQAPPKLAVARSGAFVDAAGLRLRATIGTYPALIVASAPYPLALGIGVLLFAAGLGASLLPRRKPIANA